MGVMLNESLYGRLCGRDAIMTEYRQEIKYLCSQAQLALIEGRIKNICTLDAHAGTDGIYIVSSIYFDDSQNTCYYENENGVDPREKFRIRIYNRDMGRISLECKKKQAGKTRKKSLPLETEQCRELLYGKIGWMNMDNALFNKFALQYRMNHLRPKVIIEYERTAYVYPQGNVRITFDRNLSACRDTESFGQADAGRIPILPSGWHILEVKYDELLPDYIYNAAGIDGLRQTAYSKYYMGRRVVNL